MRTRNVVGIGVLAIGLAAAPVRAREAGPTEWPLERIVSNLEQRLRDTPDDRRVWENLGRAHAFAFASKRSTLWGAGWDFFRVADRSEQDRPPEPPREGEPPLDRKPLGEADLPNHLREGVRHLSRACELDPTRERPRLTLAWLLEIGSASAHRLDAAELFGLRPPAPDESSQSLRRLVLDLASGDPRVAEDARATLAASADLEQAIPLLPREPTAGSPAAELLRRYWLERSIAEYATAFSLALDGDTSGEGAERALVAPRTELVSWEAAEGFLRLTLERGRSASEAELARTMTDTMKVYESLPVRPLYVTPLLLSPDAARPLDELIARELAVPFDLDGDGIDEAWPWIARGAGWLVWDPERRGEIRSGRQLFGTASAWLFFEDGYRVLDALDDDASGELRGPELAGIALWRDRDTDGVSDAGEVVPVEALGIVALATRATERVGESLGNPCGVELADGRILPTYDWVLESREGP